MGKLPKSLSTFEIWEEVYRILCLWITTLHVDVSANIRRYRVKTRFRIPTLHVFIFTIFTGVFYDVIAKLTPFYIKLVKIPRKSKDMLLPI